MPVIGECLINYKHELSNATHLFSYDLCPLFSNPEPLNYQIDEDTPPTHTKYVYDIALGKGIQKDGTLPIDLQCPPGSFICMTVINTRPNHPSEPPRILQVVPVASKDIKPKFRLTNTTTGYDYQEPHLQLTVHGSKYMKLKQKAVFHLFCESTSGETDTAAKLEFLYRWNGTHVFSWRSNHACPTVTALPNDHKPEPEAGDGEETLPPADPEPEGGDPSMPPRTGRTTWYITTVIIFLAVISRKWFLSRSRFYARHLHSWLSASYPHERDILLHEIGSERPLLDRGVNDQKQSRIIAVYPKYTK